jgi:glutamine amidotransferase
VIIGIIDYGLGNIKSILSAIDFLGYDTKLCSKKDDLDDISHIIIPGVGAYKRALDLLKKKDLICKLNSHVLKLQKPVLGICLGLQLMAENSTEFGINNGFGWIKGNVDLLPSKSQNLPNIGWESIRHNNSVLFDGIKQNSNFYFVHSYYLKNNSFDVVANYDYGGIKIPAVIKKENIIATQFHPEKSQDNGLKFLENFIKTSQWLKRE